MLLTYYEEVNTNSLPYNFLRVIFLSIFFHVVSIYLDLKEVIHFENMRRSRRNFRGIYLKGKRHPKCWHAFLDKRFILNIVALRQRISVIDLPCCNAKRSLGVSPYILVGAVELQTVDSKSWIHLYMDMGCLFVLC